MAYCTNCQKSFKKQAKAANPAKFVVEFEHKTCKQLRIRNHKLRWNADTTWLNDVVIESVYEQSKPVKHAGLRKAIKGIKAFHESGKAELRSKQWRFVTDSRRAYDRLCNAVESLWRRKNQEFRNNFLEAARIAHNRQHRTNIQVFHSGDCYIADWRLATSKELAYPNLYCQQDKTDCPKEMVECNVKRIEVPYIQMRVGNFKWY